MRLFSLGLCVVLAACTRKAPADAASPDAAFRVDLHEVDVRYDFDPSAARIDGHAVLTFEMRPGQTRPVFHFDPWVGSGTERDALRALVLDGQDVPVAELDVLEFSGSDQVAFEVPRELDAGVHTLTIDFSILNTFLDEEPGWFRTLVDDTVGLGNEVLWPTINAPGEQARHRLEIRVDAAEPYIGVGSRAMQPELEGDIQVFRLDTEREVSSYTVMFAVLPAADATLTTFEVSGVPVTLVSTEDSATTSEAEALTRETLQALSVDFGPFPMPSLGILLIDWPDGMEYYGATTTGLSSLSHELTHMYWGTSAVHGTWRDTWMDEALTVWWDEGGSVVGGHFSSDIVGGRSEIELGFDQRGYTRGAEMFVTVADELGQDEFIGFLAEVHTNRAFEPFTTDDFVEDLVDHTGDDAWRQTFDTWVNGGGCSSLGSVPMPGLALLPVLVGLRRRRLCAHSDSA